MSASSHYSGHVREKEKSFCFRTDQKTKPTTTRWYYESFLKIFRKPVPRISKSENSGPRFLGGTNEEPLRNRGFP